MAKMCHGCGTNIAGEPTKTSFTHLGFSVKVFKNGMICADCREKEWIEEFENYARQLVALEDKKPQVKWPKYLEFLETDYGDRYENKINHIFISLGIFSPKRAGHWEIVANGPIGLNPWCYQSYLYFVSKKDAIEFARLKYSNTLYYWEICGQEEIIKKDEVA